MRIPCKIVQSRHGVYYFRYLFTVAGQRRERRISLKTKLPHIAKSKSLLISAMMLKRQHGIQVSGMERDILKEHLERISEIEDQLRELEVSFNLPNGGNVTLKADPDKPADLQALLQASRDFWESDIGQSMKMNMDMDAKQASISSEELFPVTPPEGNTDAPMLGGITIPELIERYATRKHSTLAPKTQYEYRNYQNIFHEWITQRKGHPDFPLKQITRQDIAGFIDDLLNKNISPKTIQQKYLCAVSGLFELAQVIGSYPEGMPLPSRGHKLFSKKDQKKVQEKNSWKPFSDEDLSHIFEPSAFMAQKNPTDYWLPLMGLFTGGRIGELCQILTHDIMQLEGLWCIAITDEDECQRLKTPAAKRTIPIHPRLLELGFLQFVEDMKPFGGMLFPYLTSNAFGNFSETPSERFGKYLDTLGLTDPRKVFHSFRTTSNNRLKQQAVAEETRCQFVGHEHETTNSAIYGEKHGMQFLMDQAASKLDFTLPFAQISYPREKIITFTARKMKLKERQLKHDQVVAAKNKK
jgi:integrase